MDAEDNPLKYAPHTIDMVCADEWNHAYTREQMLSYSGNLPLL